jgi:KDO2-lipid IV(A) lauroyltransferase
MYYEQMKRGKRIMRKIEYGGVRFLMALLGILPLRLLRGFGAALGWAAFRIVGIRRSVTLANIRQALGPDLSPRQIESIGLRSYQNLGRSLVEFAAFKKLTAPDVRSLVAIDGSHYLDEAMQAQRGAVLFTGHFDNWELFGAGLTANGYPIHFLVGEQSNKQVDDLMNELRQAQGIQIISRNVALKKVLRALSRNQIVCMLPDQNAGRTGIFVDFFGKLASTYRGPATFALKQGCPIIPAFMIRRPGRPHLGIIEQPIWPDQEMEREEAIRSLTQACSNVLMEYIRRYPDHYFWAHRRWKTRPEDVRQQ